MYTRFNTTPVAPGLWTTNDGEYAFTRTDTNVWTIRRRDARTGTGIIGSAPTLNAAFTLATRHYNAPVAEDHYIAGQVSRNHAS
jgi:hypothetical protein